MNFISYKYNFLLLKKKKNKLRNEIILFSSKKFHPEELSLMFWYKSAAIV